LLRRLAMFLFSVWHHIQESVEKVG